MFGRNLYDTDETNSIFEIRLALHCPIFEEMKSSSLTVSDILSLRVVKFLVLMLVPFYTFCGADTRKNIRISNVKQCVEMSMECRTYSYFVVLNDDAEHPDQTGRGKVEAASI